MGEWFTRLNGVEYFFLVCAFIGAIFVIIRIILMLSGFGDGADTDMDKEGKVYLSIPETAPVGPWLRWAAASGNLTPSPLTESAWKPGSPSGWSGWTATLLSCSEPVSNFQTTDNNRRYQWHP